MGDISFIPEWIRYVCGLGFAIGSVLFIIVIIVKIIADSVQDSEDHGDIQSG